MTGSAENPTHNLKENLWKIDVLGNTFKNISIPVSSGTTNKKKYTLEKNWWLIVSKQTKLCSTIIQVSSAEECLIFPAFMLQEELL